LFPPAYAARRQWRRATGKHICSKENYHPEQSTQRLNGLTRKPGLMNTDLAELVRQLDLEDELDGFELDEYDLADSEFADQAAWVNPDTLTRRDARKLKQLLREHPAVQAILDDWNMGGDTQDAYSALGTLLETWGITTLDGSSVSLEAVGGHLGECAWPGCSLPRKQRQGPSGRYPRHCLTHTFEAKRKADRERLRAKRAGVLAVPECCKEWTRSGHRGECQQHRDYEAASRPPYPLTAVEAAYLGNGFHLI
jgi:hypothetical protein